MFIHFILNFGRNLRTHKTLSLINICSLAVGLTVFAIASLYVQRELSVDHSWPNADRIHRLVIQRQGLPGSPDGFGYNIDPGSYQALLSYFSGQIDAASRLTSAPVQLQVGEEERREINFLSFVDPEFDTVFNMEVLAGNLTNVLASPGLIALSEAMAMALGDAGQVGQRLLVRTPYSGGEQDFEIGAIVRLPKPSSHSIDMLTVISDYAGALFMTPPSAPWEVATPVRLLLVPGAETLDINEQIPLFVQSTLATNFEQVDVENISDHLFYELQPLREIYLNRRGFEENGLNFGDKAKVTTFAVVGLLVLLVGCSNSASLSIANALRRRKEIGIRKVLGAGKKAIMLSYLGESVLLTLLSLGLALVLQELLLTPVLTLLNINGELSPTLANNALLLAIALLAGLVNGTYPAFVLSGLQPQSILQSSLGGGSKGMFRARVFLVGGQLALTTMFLAIAFSLFTQLMVVRTQSLGYDHENLLLLLIPPSPSVPSASVLSNNLQALPGVVAAAPMVTVPPNMNLPLNINAFNLVSKQEQETEVQATRLMIVEGFPGLMSIPLLAGRDLTEDRDSWSGNQGPSRTVENALINRRAAEALGFASPENAVDTLIYMRRSDTGGQMIDAPLLIVGVLEDSLYSSIHRLPVPEFYAIPPETFNAQFMLRYQPDAATTIQQNTAALLETYNIEANFEFIENRIEAAWFQEKNESRILLIAAVMALLLSCIGMYGLLATTVVRSVKEVAIRKVMGASTGGILRLFLWRFSQPALFANLIAWPLAAWFVLRWIQRFPYQLDLLWLPLIFLSASLIVLVVAWLTIIAVTTRTAQHAPATSLRYE